MAPNTAIQMDDDYYDNLDDRMLEEAAAYGGYDDGYGTPEERESSPAE